MWQLPPLLSAVPAAQVAAANGREHRAAHFGRRGIIVALAEALVQARLVHALIVGLMAMIMRSRAAHCHGPVWPDRLQPRRVYFARGVWARILAKGHALSSILDYASLMCVLATYAVQPREGL